MRKFLVFLVAIITTVCIGVTFYQFARNDEVIKVNTQTIYINSSDCIIIESKSGLRDLNLTIADMDRFVKEIVDKSA